MTPRSAIVRMRLGLGMVTLLVSLASFVAHAAAERHEAQPQQTLTPKVGKALRGAQEAIEKEDWEGAYSKVLEAQAASGRSAYDDLQITEMLGYVELKRQNYNQACAAFEKSIDSGLLPAGQASDRLKLVTQLALQLKDYPKAILFANRAIASPQPPDPQMYGLLGQAQYLSGDYQSAAASMAQAIGKAREAGQAPEERWFQVQLSGHAQLKDEAGVLTSLKELAIAFPKKEYLQDLFGQWKRVEADDRNVLNLYRLMLELDRLTEAEDYLKFAQLATGMGFPGEALSVLERGKAAEKFSDEVDAERARRQIEAAKVAAVADRKAIASLEQSADALSADEDVQLGMAAASYGEYDKALATLERGVARGGMRRPDQAQLVLGQVLLKLKRPVEAQAAFEKVNESAPLGIMAQLWRAYTRDRAPPPAG